MIRNTRINTVYEFINELYSHNIISFSSNGNDLANKLKSLAQKFAMILLANDFLDAMLFALSRAKLEKIKPYRRFEIFSLDEISHNDILEKSDIDGLSWFLIVYFILRKVFSDYDLPRFRSFDDFIYYFTRNSERLLSQFKYIIVFYLNSLAKFLESMFNI